MHTELPNEPFQWVADLEKPTWDAYFMSLVFLAAQRSNDRQTKQGAVIVDWPSKSILGIGYNGHPRGAQGDIPVFRKGSAKVRLEDVNGTVYQRGQTVPTGTVLKQWFEKTIDGFLGVPIGEWENQSNDRPDLVQQDPDKYPYMCHCETNALLSVTQHSNDAVLYIPMPSCEACGGLVLNHPHIKINRIVYYEDRNLRNLIYQTRPDVKIEKWDFEKNGHPADLLERAATYMRLRDRDSQKLSAASTKTYK